MYFFPFQDIEDIQHFRERVAFANDYAVVVVVIFLPCCVI